MRCRGEKACATVRVAGELLLEKSVLSAPRRNGENPVRLTQIARRRCHDRALGNQQLLSGLNSPSNVFFTDEIERRLVGGGARAGRGTGGCRTSAEPSRPEKVVDLTRQHLCADAGGSRRLIGPARQP